MEAGLASTAIHHERHHGDAYKHQGGCNCESCHTNHTLKILILLFNLIPDNRSAGCYPEYFRVILKQILPDGTDCPSLS